MIDANQLTLSEGDTIAITSANLSSSDADNADGGLVYTISGVTYGQFEFVTTPGVAVISFTQADLDAGSIVFVHDGGELPPSYEVTVSDGNSSVGPQPASISFGEVNDAPIGVGDNYLLDEDTTVTGNVLANDSDNDAGDTLTAVINQDVDHGQLSLLSDGTFTYTPDPDFNGNDQFTYQVFDGTTFSAETTVRLSINAVNDAPTAIADSVQVIADGNVTNFAASGLLANDFDIDGDAFTAVLVDAPTSGSVIVNADGSWSYTSDSGFVGTVTFTYVANDGLINSAATTVSIQVVAGGTMPVTNPTTDPSTDPSPVNDANDMDGSDVDTDRMDSMDDDMDDDQVVALPETARPRNPSSDLLAPKQLEEVAAVVASVNDELELAALTVLDSAIAGSSGAESLGQKLMALADFTAESARLNFVVDNFDLQFSIEQFNSLDEDRQGELQFVSGTTATLFVGVSAGFAVWCVSGTYLASLLATTMPSWTGFDVIHVVNSPRKRSEDDTSIAEIIAEGREANSSS